MAILDRIFPITIMALILLFSLIHLAVSVGIIVPFRKYDDIFRPQIGLSSFNLVVCFIGLITGILGLVSIFMNSETFVKIVCVISGVLGIFALASLITAIILNVKSSDYVSTTFSNNLMNYQNNQNTKNKIDLLQVKYTCCGTNMWVDWAAAGLGSTSTTTTGTSTGSTTTPTSSTTTTTTTTSVVTNSSSGRKKRDLSHTSGHLHRLEKPLFASASKVKRQATATYGGIEGLPLTYGVTLPSSCCTSEALLTSNTSNSYCVSNANGVVNHFNTAGCAKPIGNIAGNQAMGFGIINSFMVVLAFVAMPALLEMPSEIV